MADPIRRAATSSSWIMFVGFVVMLMCLFWFLGQHQDQIRRVE